MCDASAVPRNKLDPLSYSHTHIYFHTHPCTNFPENEIFRRCIREVVAVDTRGVLRLWDLRTAHKPRWAVGGYDCCILIGCWVSLLCFDWFWGFNSLC